MKMSMLAAAVLLAACDRGSAARTPDETPLRPEAAVVMRGSTAGELLGGCGVAPSPELSGYWTPTPEQIRELEAGLAPLLRSALRQRAADGVRGGGRMVGHYYRQYGGVVLRGRRTIYVNGFSDFFIRRTDAPGDTLPWRTAPISVCDGGYGIFRVEYDPATRRFGKIEFNGFA